MAANEPDESRLKCLPTSEERVTFARATYVPRVTLFAFRSDASYIKSVGMLTRQRSEVAAPVAEAVGESHVSTVRSIEKSPSWLRRFVIARYCRVPSFGYCCLLAVT